MRRAVRVVPAVLGIGAILTSVGGPAAVASYNHASKVARKYGETAQMSDWLPLTTDGMLVAALAVMYARRWRGEPVGRWPWIAFVFGTIATLAANLAAADLTAAASVGEVVGRLSVAVWPPIAFALTLELVALLLPFLRPAAVDTPAWPSTWRIGIPVYPYSPAVPDPHLYPSDERSDTPSFAPVPADLEWLNSTPWDEYAPDPVRLAPVPAAVPARPRDRRPSTPAAASTGTPRNGKATRWTPQDEQVRVELQSEADRTRVLPSVRDIKTRYGMGQDRAVKIRGKLTDPVQTESVQ